MKTGISRRDFLWQVTGCSVFMSAIPMPVMGALFRKKKKIFLSPFWLDTLSKGPQYIPHKAKANFPLDVNGNEMKDAAYEILRKPAFKNQALNHGRIKQTDLLMDNIVLGYKKSQYLFGQIQPDFEYHCSDFMKDVTFDEDPVLGKIMKDLSKIILDYIHNIKQHSEFSGFNTFQKKLLNSAMEYALEGVGISEKVLQKTLAPHKFMAQESLAQAYYHYGLALDHLGRTDDATCAFRVALQLFPDNASAKHNLDPRSKFTSY